MVVSIRHRCLSTETVQSLALTLESVNDIKSSDSLTTGVFSVSHSVTDDVLEENLENTTSLLVDETGNTLHTTTTSETTNGRLLQDEQEDDE